MVYSILFSGRESGSPTDLMGPTRKQAVYNELLYLISELRLPPGTRLIESDLAKRFGVSKTPVREALHILERDLLVEFVPYTGATVRYMSLEEYEQLVFLVDAIEQPALRTVADNITDQELEEIWALVLQLQEAKKRQEGVLYRDLIRTIHSRLFRGNGFATSRSCAFTHSTLIASLRRGSHPLVSRGVGSRTKSCNSTRRTPKA